MCAPSVCRFIAWNVFQWMIIVKCLVRMYCGNGNLIATSKINPHLYMAQKWQHICICFSFTFFFQLSFDLIRCLQNKKYKTQIRDFEGKRMHMRNARQQQPWHLCRRFLSICLPIENPHLRKLENSMISLPKSPNEDVAHCAITITVFASFTMLLIFKCFFNVVNWHKRNFKRFMHQI